MAFDDWLSVKDLKDQAIRALKVLKKPIIAFSDNSSSAGSESTVLSTVISMENATKEIPFSMDVLHYCKTVINIMLSDYQPIVYISFVRRLVRG